MSASSIEGTEIHFILENLAKHENDSPIHGRKRLDNQLESMWKLGFVTGATSCVTIVLNSMCLKKYGEAEVRNEIIMPLLLGAQVEDVESKMQKMIAKSWRS